MEQEIDYKTLLWKYLNHVGECEGVTFVHHIGGWKSKVRFSKAEITALEEIENMPRWEQDMGDRG